ncbi:MAG: cation diffusion facilitator family transporter [Deltaproteobacteria bacterium]|nr:cation diffusion facilitator family transporter [Deltaproteobacteria bacterium]
MAASSKKAIYAALVGNTLIAITKFVAAAITGSSAMFSESIHSLVDTGNQGLLLHGLKQSRKPANRQFPFGHGKEVYFWSFIVAIFIFALGSGISIYEGLHSILHPEPIESPLINYIVLGLAIVFESAALTIAFKEFKKAKRTDMGYFEAVHRGKDPTLFVVVFEDTAALLGLLVALVGISLSLTTGIYAFDGIASVIIGLILGGTAIWLAVETKSLLIGESANSPVVDGIRIIIDGFDEIDQVNEVLTMHMGPEFILVNISADFNSRYCADDIEKAIAAMNQRIKEHHPLVKRVFIEAESRRPATCINEPSSSIG